MRPAAQTPRFLAFPARLGGVLLRSLESRFCPLESRLGSLGRLTLLPRVIFECGDVSSLSSVIKHNHGHAYHGRGDVKDRQPYNAPLLSSSAPLAPLAEDSGGRHDYKPKNLQYQHERRTPIGLTCLPTVE